MTDKDAKTAFVNFLKEALQPDTPEIDDKKKEADVIVKIGENPDDWFYFEIKSSDRTKTKATQEAEFTTESTTKTKNKKRFGAIFESQWKKSLQYPGHYYFVIIDILSKKEDIIKDCNFYILSPDEMRRYVTGFNVLTYTNIGDASLANMTKLSIRDFKEGVWKNINEMTYKGTKIPRGAKEQTEKGEKAYKRMISMCKKEIRAENRKKNNCKQKK